MTDDTAGSAGPGVPGQVTADATAAAPTRRARLRAAAAARGVPLPTILAAVAVVVLTYLAGKLAYRLRDVVLLIVVGGFVALILNPLVVYVQQRVPRRGWAVAIVTVWAALVFVGLALAFSYPLVNGLTHFAHRLPSYVQDVERGRGCGRRPPRPASTSHGWRRRWTRSSRRSASAAPMPAWAG